MSQKNLLQTYLNYDPAAKSAAEIIFFYPGFKALCFHNVANRLYRMRHFLLARAVSEFSRFLTGIDIHPGARLGKNIIIDHGMGVVIGETAQVGNNVIIFQGVTLGSKNIFEDKSINAFESLAHPNLSEPLNKRHPTIEDGVVLCAGAKVLGNITINHGACVGANAVVTKNVRAFTKVAGVPAKEIFKSSVEQSNREETYDLHFRKSARI